jgi:TolA-binding protein
VETKIADLAQAVKLAQTAVLQEKQAGEQKLAVLEKQHQAMLAETLERHREQLEEVRSAKTLLPLNSVETVAQDRSAIAYSQGINLYFFGRYAEAEEAFHQATTQHAGDARYWYFLGMSQVMQGKSGEAAFKKGLTYEMAGRPTSRAVDTALERIQGRPRQQLNAFRR